MHVFVVATGVVGASLLWSVPGSAQKPRDTLVTVTLPAFDGVSMLSADTIGPHYVTNKAQSVWAEIRSGQNFFLTFGTHRLDSARGVCIELPEPVPGTVVQQNHPLLTDVSGVPDVCSGDAQWFTGDGQSVLGMTAGEEIKKLMRMHWHDPATDQGYNLSWGSDLDGFPGPDSDYALVKCIVASGGRCTNWQVTHDTTASGTGRARLYDETFGLIADYRPKFSITVTIP